MSASDSTESKSNMLDIEASLKASFMGGLIKVGGSAKYLNDHKQFKNQSRVAFQYKATTKFKELSIDDMTLDTKQMEVIKEGLATHVVTGILYGAHAFFVFDSEKLEASQVQKIEGSMHAVIKKIPSLNIKGKVDIKLTATEKALTDTFSCKFHGDFLLKSNPATFKDAVQTYVELPQLLGTNGENSVPVAVWLMPLKCFDPKAPELMTGISIGLVMKVQEALEDLKETQRRCNDSLGDKVVESFPVLHKQLSTFLKLCGDYESSLQQTVAEKLPSIRARKEDESSLETVFKDRHTSPFSHEKLTKWLDHKEREINVIRSVVDFMKDVKIVQNRSELDREVLGNAFVVCFVFTSMESADPCLEAMDQYANSLECASTEEEPWYYSDEVLQKMRVKAQDFMANVKSLMDNCFLIAAIENEKFEGATVYSLQGGVLQTENPHARWEG
ncbi:hypothetical protein CesoFtcFv8_021659 [Champsocephalus esox]|uniref:SNTX thioredoxin-like domain-containing protein n=1 Tax=Champsocephalus esox TaxID=159716 RepID=A0AAN8B9X4_9TELE|nr:hypothetical protein CesoFtcFv8_021659 [Champsocephalus esox]